MAGDLLGGHSIFRVPAEERGYAAHLVDERDNLLSHTLRNAEPPAGALFFNPAGHGLWVPTEDLAVFGDLALRAHVLAGRMRAEVRR